MGVPLLGHLAGHGEERERCINGDILEEKIFWKRYFENLLEGKEGKEKGKKK